ncbi:hypothetical protein B0H14DRAFT_2349706 [Mycena olivaceomarginata]|nr:hypothetical protein B0H14DRAFT_2349706 [Mycena olivaceomarginata]
MQNPVSEIGAVVSLLTAAAAPQIQKSAFLKYITPDAGFRHPICNVTPGPGSRERVLGIFQWYRIMSPHIDITVTSAVHNPSNNTLLLDVVQEFHIRLSPFKPAPSRLLGEFHLPSGQRHPGNVRASVRHDFGRPPRAVLGIAAPGRRRTYAGHHADPGDGHKRHLPRLHHVEHDLRGGPRVLHRRPRSPGDVHAAVAAIRVRPGPHAHVARIEQGRRLAFAAVRGHRDIALRRDQRGFRR